MSESETEIPSDEAPVQYLGFWARFVAFLIDSTAATIILAPLTARLMDEIIISDYDLGDQAELMLLLQRLTTQLSFDLLLILLIGI